MRILVTGGAGFIGSHVADAYRKAGHEVGVLDNLSTGRRENIHPATALFEVGLLDSGLAGAVAKFKPDILNHHAAQVNVRKSVESPDFDASVNVMGSIRLFEAAIRAGVKKIIYASSGGACYGEPTALPAPEETPVQPLSPYGASKYAVELYLGVFSRLNNIRHTVLRYANVYGPRQDPHGEAGVVAIFTDLMLAGKQPTIFGDGTKTRDYVFVGDVVQANMLALQGGDGRAYNVGYGHQVSDYELFAAVRNALRLEIEPIYADFRAGEVRHIALDASRLRNELGWQPSVTLAEGIKITVTAHKRKK